MKDWDAINGVNRMQAYIISHLDEEITLQELADAAGYSMWHAARIFKELLNQTPFEYIRCARLTQAARCLRDTDEKILNVALDHGFESHDGFTRSFVRQFHMTPRVYRTETPAIAYFTYYPIRNYYLCTRESEEDKMEEKQLSSIVTVTAVKRPARQIILQRSADAKDYFSYCEEKGCDWEGILNSVAEKMDSAALMTLPQKLVREGTSAIAAGIEVPETYSKKLPEGYEMIFFPPCEMLYFQGQPFENEEDFPQALEIVMQAIRNYRPEQWGYQLDLSLAPCFNFGASAEKGAKMALPVRPL